MLENVNLLELEGEFTLPSSRGPRREEKYTYPVLTINGIDPEKKGAGRKISLNKAAITELGYNLDNTENAVAFKFAGDKVFVINVTGHDVMNTFKLTKSGTFSNKNVYEYLSKKFNIADTSVDFDLEIQMAATVEGSPAGGLLTEILLNEDVSSETRWLQPCLDSIS